MWQHSLHFFPQVHIKYNPDKCRLCRESGHLSLCSLLLLDGSVFANPAILHKSLVLGILPSKCLLCAVFPGNGQFPQGKLFSDLQISLQYVLGTWVACLVLPSTASPARMSRSSEAQSCLFWLKRHSQPLPSVPGHVASGSDHPPGPSGSCSECTQVFSPRAEMAGRYVSLTQELEVYWA